MLRKMSALKLRVEKKLYIHDLLQCEERVIMPDLNNMLNNLFKAGRTQKGFIKKYRALEASNLLDGNKSPIFQFQMDDVALANLYDSFRITDGRRAKEEDVANLANFLKAQNITDPVEIFAIYQFMYRNGYLSFNHNFN